MDFINLIKMCNFRAGAAPHTESATDFGLGPTAPLLMIVDPGHYCRVLPEGVSYVTVCSFIVIAKCIMEHELKKV